MEYQEAFLESLSNLGDRYERQKFIDELETYKKIAEKLAETSDIMKHKEIEICVNISDDEFNKKTCIDCIIDWARKEVEKDE